MCERTLTSRLVCHTAKLCKTEFSAVNQMNVVSGRENWNKFNIYKSDISNLHVTQKQFQKSTKFESTSTEKINAYLTNLMTISKILLRKGI